MLNGLREVTQETLASAIPYVGIAKGAIDSVSGSIDALDALDSLNANVGFNEGIPVLEKAINGLLRLGEGLQDIGGRFGKKIGRLTRKNDSSTLDHGLVGEVATYLVFHAAKSTGFLKEVTSIQNASGHGIDLLAKDAGDVWRAFEVKTSISGRRRALSKKERINQRSGPLAYVESRLERAANENWLGQGSTARRIYDEIQAQEFDHGLPGNVIHITNFMRNNQAVKFYDWVSGSRLGLPIGHNRI